MGHLFQLHQHLAVEGQLRITDMSTGNDVTREVFGQLQKVGLGNWEAPLYCRPTAHPPLRPTGPSPMPSPNRPTSSPPYHYQFVDLNSCIREYASEMERLAPLLNARMNHEAREDERRDREAIADEEARRARLHGLHAMM